MNQSIKQRREELQRISNVTHIEAEALLLAPGEIKSFRIRDIQAYQRLRTRFCRLKESTGRQFEVKMRGSTVSVKRVENV